MVEEEIRKEAEKKSTETIFKELLYKEDNLDNLHKKLWTKLSHNEGLTDKIDTQVKTN